jgi:hypothetical protein
VVFDRPAPFILMLVGADEYMELSKPTTVVPRDSGNNRHVLISAWIASSLCMFGSTLPCEHLLTDQAEAQGFIENPEDLANLVRACEHYRSNLIKHARLIRFVKHLLPVQCWYPQAKSGNDNCRLPLSSGGKRSPARFHASWRPASGSFRSVGQ